MFDNVAFATAQPAVEVRGGEAAQLVLIRKLVRHAAHRPAHAAVGPAQKALDALADIDWARALSPYGRMQLQHVRYRAYLQLGNHTEADNVLAYLREHHDDAADTWLQVLLDSGDEDGAAAQLMSELRDSSKRSTALALVQDYELPPALPRIQESRDRWKALLARADVTAAITEVGRREKQPVFRTPD